MEDWFSRDIQNAILKDLYEVYPTAKKITDIAESIKHPADVVSKNVKYLEMSKLIYMWNGMLENQLSEFPALNNKGIDFLKQDGGLSAILNVQIVKLHSDTVNDLKNLLLHKLEQSEIPEEQKKKLLSKLNEYGDEATKHLLTKLLDAGIEKLPTLLNTLGLAGLFN